MAAVPCFFLLSLLLTFSLFNVSFSLSEDESLVKLKKSFIQADALNNWVSGSNPCQEKWVGIICFGGKITGLHLTNLGLSGTIDIDALQQLPGLRTISLGNNSFAGAIPAFNKLGTLRSLLLSNNEFSGQIPNDFFVAMISLKRVWVSGNKFTGKIPESLMQLPHLGELHLEDNQFSGTIPPLKHPELVTSLNLSNNNLEGQIPESLSIFNADMFQNNEKLCGKPLNKDCAALSASSDQQSPSPSNAKFIVWMAAAALLGLFVLFTIFSGKMRHRDDDFSMLEKERHGEANMPMPVHRPSKKSETSQKGGGSNRRGANKSGGNELIMINSEKGSFGMPDLMKATAEVLGSGGLGSAYKAAMSNGLSVVVKRMREMNMMARDMFDAEMRRFGRIRHKNILTPLAYHYRKEEKLLISEYMPKGSLLYVLHGDRGISHAALNWETRLKIIKGIANGLQFLYTEYASYNLPHGNLKSSNVLLTDEYEPVLGDYALDPLTNPGHASQTMFAYRSPECLKNQEVSPKSDVFCLGIIILEVVTGKFPSQYHINGKGGTDVVQWVQQARSRQREQEVIDPDIASNSDSVDQMGQLLRVGIACTESNPEQRLDMKEAIRQIEEM